VQEGVFLRWGYVKDTAALYYHRKSYPKQQYVYQDLSSEIDYIKVGSFKSFYPTLSEAEAFYRKIKGTLNKPHLILDLRGNTGGGDRNSDILLEQLKNYLKQGQLHVLINSWTGSNAEQYALKLKKMKNVTIYGLPTLGALAYEKKGKVNHTLPSSGFIVTLPTKIHKEYLPYETKGVQPDHLLSIHKDWLEQVRKHIEIK
jgi:C-terminal processing protease CtpA/Prc